jgi:hypothetical protein
MAVPTRTGRRHREQEHKVLAKFPVLALPLKTSKSSAREAIYGY